LLQRKAVRFSIRFLEIAGCLALMLVWVVKGFVWLESHGVFPPAALISETDSTLFREFLGMIPSALMLLSGFCGLEFFREQALQEKAHLEEQLLFLRNQVNPRRMFNVLNHIHLLMQKNVDSASELLIGFRISCVISYRSAIRIWCCWKRR